MNKWINTLRFNDHLGAQLSTRGTHALTGGPSVQVQFPHLKISTLTTGCDKYKIFKLSRYDTIREYDVE